MKKLFSLGELYVSDFLALGQQPKFDPIELKLMMDEDGLVHLDKMAPNESMWGGERYWYSSGVNISMRNALKDVVDSVLPLVKNGSSFLDVASNDGTLLSFVPKDWRRVGIDPCNGDILKAAQQHGIIVNDYFSAEALYRARLFPPKFDIVSSVAMFYDVQEPDKFIQDVYEVLEDEGIWVLQLSYTPLMIRQLAFDNICHEHFAYYSFGSMWKLLMRNGFRIVDCQLNDINGGSFRLFARKDKADPKNFGTQAYRDVCEFRMATIETYEAEMEMGSARIWYEFNKDIEMLKAKVVGFILSKKDEGKRIMGYGASTKGNTLLQYFGLDNTLIDAIAERQECKWGLRTVGTNIPIISEEEMRKAQPDYLLVLPWHFISEMAEREKEWHGKGGRWIVPMPKFEII